MTYEIIKSGKHEYQIDKLLLSALKDVKRHNKKDWDFKILISGDGMTRTGKSTMAAQIAQYLDPTFADNWKERMIFDYNKLITTSREIGRGKAIVYDEARQGLDAKRTLHRQTLELLDFFSQSGSLNQFAIIVLPDFFELVKSIALNNTIFLINCYARNGFYRGYFDFYNRKDKRYLYFKGKLFMDYKSQRPSFKGTFSKYLPFNKNAYNKLKQKTLEVERKKRKERKKPRDFRKDGYIQKLIKYLNNEAGYTQKQIGEIAGMSGQSVSDYKNIPPEKIKA